MSEAGRWTQVAEIGTARALRFAGWFHRRFGRRPSMVLAVIAVAAVGAPASLGGGGWVEVLAEVNGEEYTPGELADYTFGVQNFSNETLSVNLMTYVVYVDGRRQLIFPPSVHVLEPDDGVVNFAHAFVPANAGLGTATLHVIARIGRSSQGRLVGNRTIHEEDTFEVVSE